MCNCVVKQHTYLETIDFIKHKAYIHDEKTECCVHILPFIKQLNYSSKVVSQIPHLTNTFFFGILDNKNIKNVNMIIKNLTDEYKVKFKLSKIPMVNDKKIWKISDDLFPISKLKNNQEIYIEIGVKNNNELFHELLYITFKDMEYKDIKNHIQIKCLSGDERMIEIINGYIRYT